MLYLIATPIGNLEDVTLRALRLLREVTLIAAEDTRHTAKLLRHYGIQTPTTSFHEHNEKKKGPQLIARLKQGDTLALVTDAGTPLLSDPGGRLVKDALSHGITVHAIPGPSAILTALVMSGFTDTSFTYAGFPPSRASARQSWLFDLSCEPRPLVLFEAPHRIRAMLRDMLEVLGDREVALCREMTKLHEELVTRGQDLFQVFLTVFLWPEASLRSSWHLPRARSRSRHPYRRPRISGTNSVV